MVKLPKFFTNFLLIFGLSIVGSSSASAVHEEVNGCTGVPNAPAGADFTPACNNHDICYGTLDESRQSCDNRFERELRAICERTFVDARRNPLGTLGNVASSGAALGRCYQAAEIYYVGTLTAGGRYYEAAQRHAREVAARSNPTPTTVAGNYRISDGTIFFSNGSDAYCTYTSSEHIVLTGNREIRSADSLPPFRNNGPCPVMLPAGAYRLVDGRIIASNGSAFCRYVSHEHYRRRDGRAIRQLNGEVPLHAMENHFDCAQ